MKRTVGFRLSDDVLHRLGDLAQSWSCTRTAVVERLVDEAFRGPEISNDAPTTNVHSGPPKKVPGEDRPIPPPAGKQMRSRAAVERVLNNPNNSKKAKTERGEALTSPMMRREKPPVPQWKLDRK